MHAEVFFYAPVLLLYITYANFIDVAVSEIQNLQKKDPFADTGFRAIFLYRPVTHVLSSGESQPVSLTT